MLTQSKIDPGDLFWNFITDGYRCDQVLSLRRLTESNLARGKPKSIKQQVNSLRGLAEHLQDVEAINKLSTITNKLNDVANKVFAHNDLKTADNERVLTLPKHDDLDEMLKDLYQVATDLGNKIEVNVPDKLVPINRFDWSQAFSYPWRPHNYDDSNIWNEL